MKNNISDLEWYFWYGEAECGVHSNYTSLFSALLYSTKEDESIDLQCFNDYSNSSQSTVHYTMAAVNRYRTIHHKYCQLSSKSKIILEKYYEEAQYSHPYLQKFGPGVALIPYTKIGENMSKLLLKEPSTNFVKYLEKNVTTVKKQVTKLFNTALQEYQEIAKQKDLP